MAMDIRRHRRISYEYLIRKLNETAVESAVKMENPENSQRALGPLYQSNLCSEEWYLCDNVKTMRGHYRDRHVSKLLGEEFKRLIVENQVQKNCNLLN